MTEIDQYKEEIASKYVDEFKKELNFFERILIFPIEDEMKSILKSSEEIEIDEFKDLEDLGFRRKVLGIRIFDRDIFESLTSKTLKFLKEKQKEILQAETEGRVYELFKNVIEGHLDDLNSSVPGEESGEENGEESGEENGEEGKKEGGVENGEESGEENGEESGEENGEEGKKEGGVEGKKEGGVEGKVELEEGGNSHSAEISIGSGTALAGTHYKSIEEIEKRMGITNKMPNGFDGARTREIMNNLAEEMEQHSTVKMNRVQKRVYENSIKRFKEAASSLNGDTEKALKARQNMSNRLPSNYLETVNINSRILDLVDGLPDDELVKIIGKNDEEIVDFFKIHNIDVSKDFAKTLKISQNVNEIRQITSIARNGRKLSNIVKGIKGMGVITFLFAGFDIRCYIDDNKEAELVSKVNEARGKVLKDQATMHLYVGLGAIGLEALTIVVTYMAGGSLTGPRGTVIGVAVGVIAAAVTMTYDELYANKKKFYAQNRYDFINQKRTKIKQSIVQLFQSNRFHMDESMKKSIEDDRGPNSEINTMEDAWEALIYQEEVISGNFGVLQQYYGSGKSEQEFLNGLSKDEQETYKNEKDEMEKIISNRMEYIRNFVERDPDSEQYKKMKDSLDKKEGMLFVEQILADSKIYSYLKSEDENPYISNYKDLTVDEYKESFKNKLSSEYPNEFKIFEKINRENPVLLHEICRGVDLSKTSIISHMESNDTHEYSDVEWETIKHNIGFIEKYYEYIKLGVPKERDMDLGLSGTSLDYNYIEQVLLDFNSINKRPVRENDISTAYLSSNEIGKRIDEIDDQVSNSVFQNILYSIAREIHGYTGNNNKFELVGFYTGDGDSTGVYMDGERKINDVTGFLFFGEKDSTIKNPDNMTKEELLNLIVGEVDLDSDAEAADNDVTLEFRNRVKAIIEREYSFRENKKEYEKMVIDFIKTNNNGKDGYVEIPDNIVFNAKKAGIGDVHKFLYKIEGSEIIALTRGDLADTKLYFDNSDIQIRYETLDPLRDKLSEQENKIVGFVDEMEKKLNKLRAKQGHFLSWDEHEDDLDIPVELERIMSQKSIEWNNIKESLLYMKPFAAHDCLVEKSKEYYDFFNGMYLGILNRVTNMNHVMGMNSNDIDGSTDFMYAAQFIGTNIVSIKNGELKIAESISDAIKKHLPDLFEFYTDTATGKNIKGLLMSEDEREQKLGQELAKKIFELCLEETVLEIDSEGNISNISTLDFSDSDLEKVKDKIKKGIDGIGFGQALEEYSSSSYQYQFEHSIRRTENSETDINNEIDAVVKTIISTMDEVDRARERKNIKFNPDKNQNKEGKVTGELGSRGHSEKITVSVDNSKNINSITIEGLGITFTDIQEGFRTVNFINWIHNNAKSHPYGSDSPSGPGHLGYYQWSNGGDLERDVLIDMGIGNMDSPADIDIIESDKLREKFGKIQNSEDFLGYINDFLQ